jgi:tRNA(Ile)-lysidine synthase
MPRSKKCSVPAATEAAPVSPDEAGRLFATVEECGCLLLAVSGGSDSMALMWLAARWARETAWPGTLHVAVVDHGLRAEAADEARFVIVEAGKLGLKAHVLKWDGPHPKTGIPAAAREARYELLFGLARKLKAIVVTAHTQDDQAETLLMRLARGSGVDGLSAMAVHALRDDMKLFRPMLGFSRERLRATLHDAGVSWIDDPTNENTAHERVRVRKALDVLDGLGVTRASIALSAGRLGRARAALEVAAGGLMQVAVHIEQGIFARISLERWCGAPAELQVRVISQLARMFGGGQEISLSGAERVRDWMKSDQGRATTFGGCRFVRRKREIVVGREAARVHDVPLEVSADPALIWDDRYEIIIPQHMLPATVMPVKVFAMVWRGLRTCLILSGKGCRWWLARPAISRRSIRRPSLSALFTRQWSATMAHET